MLASDSLVIFTIHVQYWTMSIQQQMSNANNFIDISERVTYLLTYFLQIYLLLYSEQFY